MCIDKTPWEKAVEFHGHVCPGLAIGYRAAGLALQALGVSRSSDEEIIAIVENNSCGVDAVQSLAGCSFGKGNLFYHDYGKQAYTLARRRDGRAVRVSVRYGSLNDPEFAELRARANQENAVREDKYAYERALEKRVRGILEAGAEVFEIKDMFIELPPPAAIYQTLQCSSCGEGVMETRVNHLSGNLLCLPCYEKQL